MRAGTLRHVVTIEVPEDGAADSLGNPTTTFTTTITERMSKSTEQGREFVEGAARLGEEPTVWESRFRSGMTTRHRLVHGGTTYDVHSVFDPDGYRKRLVWFTTKVAAGS